MEEPLGKKAHGCYPLTPNTGAVPQSLSYVKCFSHQPITYNCHAHYIPLKTIRSSEITGTIPLEFVTTVRGVCMFKGGCETQ